MSFPAKPTRCSWSELQREHPLSQGLVGAWNFWEGGGDVIEDSSGQGNNGAITGSTWGVGLLGSCPIFGTGYVLATEYPYVSPMSMGGWFRWVSGTTQLLLYNGDSSKSGWGLILYGASSTLHVLAGGVCFRNTGVPMVSKVWEHIWVTRASSAAPFLIYRNGSLSNSLASIVTNTPTVSFCIGGSNVLSNGSADAVRFYNRALSAGEVYDLYRDSFAMYRPRPTQWLVPATFAAAAAYRALRRAAR